MNILLSFIGKLPEYTIHCVYQIRLYYTGDIYLIYNDYDSIFIDKLLKFKVILINYEDVNKHELDIHINKFGYISGLTGREQLFYRSYERMFLANNLINKLLLNDTLFMEIDNLIYDNPENWIEEFSIKGLSFMSHSHDSCSSGIMYIKNNDSMIKLTNHLLLTLNNPSGLLSEMISLKKYYDDNSDNVYIMPVIYNDKKNNVFIDAYKNYKKHVYDHASYGQYLLGIDPFHNNGKIITGKSYEHHAVVCNRYKIEFKTINGFKKPYIFNENINDWILIRNLHVHSKDLLSGLSKDFSDDLDDNIEIITGEKMQMLADLYIGETEQDFYYNPKIGVTNKNILINNIPDKYNNPKIIYCYGNTLNNLYNKIDNFMNNFILISGNNDEEITEQKYKKIADHPKIIKWYAQNVCFKHEKLEPFTIGLANEMWEHGYSQKFLDIYKQKYEKTNDVYFNFNINTHYSRNECYDKLKDYYEFLQYMNPIENFKRLSSYKFCICPRGNGIDTHRLAECWYLKVVPIVLKNEYIDIIKNSNSLPIIILNDWDELKDMKLNYNDYHFNYDKYIDFNYYKKII
jgi:hypothetical protein